MALPKRALLRRLILLGLVGSGGWIGWSRYAAGPTEQRYLTTAVRRGDIVRTVTATGQLTAVVNVQVGSQISGIIQELYADFNSPVKAGDVVAKIDDSTYRAVVGGMEGELEGAKARVAIMRLTEGRKRALVEGSGVSRADYDQSLADLQQAEADVRIREAQLEKARIDLERCSITAPIDGIVVSRNVDVGQTVAASLQAPVLFTIAKDLTQMNIEANVSEADIGGVREGQRVGFSVDAFPDRAFEGSVVQVRYAPVIVENVVSYVVVISVANPSLELRPGMTANVAIELERRDGVLALSNAVFRFRPPSSESDQPREGDADQKKGGKSAGKTSAERTVFRVGDGKLEAVKVRRGLANAIETEVIGNLEEGDLIATGVVLDIPQGNTSSNPFGGNSTRDLMPQGGGGR